MALQSAAAAIVAVYFLCLLSLSTAKGHSRQCYEVGNETVCYFLLEDNLTMDWNDANKTCRESNSTLAVIPNSDYQKAIQRYLEQQLTKEIDAVFTAGRKLWAVYPNPPWRWINGKQYKEPLSSYDDSEIFGCIQSTRITSCSFSTGSFICQYPESTCKMLDKATRQIRYGSHCFVVHDDDLRWNHARNLCIRGGGDLATFDDVNISMALHNLSSVTKTDTLYFIGLQKKWWTWQATESIINIRYSEWPERKHGYKPEDTNGRDCLCLVRKYDFKWTSCDCYKGKAIVCQSESNPFKCYDMSGTQTCYLTPKYTKRLSFASATQWCRDHNATLPIIKNKLYQESLESFLKTIHLGLPVHLQWTSGLKVKTGIWTWINGQPFRDSDMGTPSDFVSFYLRSRSKETVEQKGRLLGSHGFEPNSANARYMCQFSGDVCKAVSSASDKCMVVNEEQVTWYEARLRCINGGGDLATFEDASDFKKISSRLASNNNSYHIGLENSRWIWYQPDKLEDGVRYTNWNESVRKFSMEELSIDSKCDYTESEICARDLENSNFCMCLETSAYTWTPCDCDSSLRFVCQRDRLSSLPLKEADPQNEMCGNHEWIIIAGIEGLIIVGFIIFIVFIFLRLRKESKASGNADTKLHFRRHRDLANINRAMPSIPSEYQDLKLYDEIHETTMPCTCMHEIIHEAIHEANDDIKTNDDIK